jgi:hypothetical protein
MIRTGGEMSFFEWGLQAGNRTGLRREGKIHPGFVLAKDGFLATPSR